MNAFIQWRRCAASRDTEDSCQNLLFLFAQSIKTRNSRKAGQQIVLYTGESTAHPYKLGIHAGKRARNHGSGLRYTAVSAPPIASAGKTVAAAAPSKRKKNVRLTEKGGEAFPRRGNSAGTLPADTSSGDPIDEALSGYRYSTARVIAKLRGTTDETAADPTNRPNIREGAHVQRRCTYIHDENSVRHVHTEKVMGVCDPGAPGIIFVGFLRPKTAA